MAEPTLQQLKSVQLQHKAEVSVHAWQRLVEFLLQLQSHLPEGGVVKLLLLLAQHAEHAQQSGILSGQALQLAQRQAAGLQTCLAALLPLRSLVAVGVRKQTSLDEISQSLLIASVTWHGRQQGQAVMRADISSGTASSLREEAGPRLAGLLGRLTSISTTGRMPKPAVMAMADLWVP